jgi:hypothetical protein
MREGDSLACKFPVPCYSLKTGKFSLLNNGGMGNNELGQQRGKQAIPIPCSERKQGTATRVSKTQTASRTGPPTYARW